MDDIEISDENTEKTDTPQKMGGGASNLKPWLFKKGQSGNPKGRPPGSKSLKTFVREYLEKLPDEDKMAFMDGMPKDILWRMAEGQPHQTSEHDVKGNVIIQFHDSFNKNANTPQETTGGNQQ